ncbi:hypothetical protein T439DRAFT_306246, partial [Meredithblackwellia eburnea MCA 4105]
MAEQDIHVTPSPLSSLPTHRAPPVYPSLRFSYSASKERDSNLLILFHGLGDTQKPFFNLGKSLNLPQTAVLAVEGLKRVPLLEEEAWQWWESFDQLGELIPNPNPTPAISTLIDFLTYLTASPTGPQWLPSQIHLFGFSQGGSLAIHLALAWSLLPTPASGERNESRDLKSVISVEGPLLTHPNNLDYKSRSRVLLVGR